MFNTDDQYDILKSEEYLASLKTEILAIVEEGRDTKLKSEIIADKILYTLSIIKNIIVDDGENAERPANILEIFLIAEKAVKQAAFEGAIVVLPSGGRIKMKDNISLPSSI